MSNTAVATLNDTQVAMPADIFSMFADVMKPKTETIPHITFKGKEWTVHTKNGSETLVDKENETPKPTIEVIVVGFQPKRQRMFYAGKFTEGNGKAPDCFTYDGVAPSAESKFPQCLSCKDCPQAVKGSKITERGIATTACTQNKVIAVISAGDMEGRPVLRLRIPPTSVYDKDGAADEVKGWFAWDAYVRKLQDMKYAYPACITKIRFKPGLAHPQLQFKLDGFIDMATANIVKEKMQSDETKEILGIDKPHATEVKLIGEGDAEPAQTHQVSAKTEAVVQQPTQSKDPVKSAESKIDNSTDDDEIKWED